MTAKLKQSLATAVEQVQKSRRRLPVRRNGEIVAAVVPAEDLEVLEEMDRRDIAAVRRTMARVKAGKEKLIPWAEAKKKLKL